MDDTIAWTAEMRRRRQEIKNTGTCKFCGKSIRWEKYYKEGERLYRWRARNPDNTLHGQCVEKMGITKQYKWKKK